jgi:hypothetical protein
MRFCKDCVYFKNENLCYSPKNGYDLVTGEVKAKIASFCRSDNQLLTTGCGPDGAYFTPKIVYASIPKKRWWNRYP